MKEMIVKKHKEYIEIYVNNEKYTYFNGSNTTDLLSLVLVINEYTERGYEIKYEWYD